MIIGIIRLYKILLSVLFLFGVKIFPRPLPILYKAVIKMIIKANMIEIIILMYPEFIFILR